jgi:hypothetical protein
VNTTEDEKVFLERAIEFALTRKVYLGVTYATVDPVAQNKLVFITKQGKIGINYNKANPVPGVVSSIMKLHIFKLIPSLGDSTCWSFCTSIRRY